MYKNQLQELAQRSCFNLPAYSWKREGPDHSPRFKASVNFNGELFESPFYCSTLRQAQHSAAQLALNILSSRLDKSLTARLLDESGVYKNLVQETAHKAGLKLPVYTTVRSGTGHVPVFTCTLQLASFTFTGHSAYTKKQAEKNAAIAAWSALTNLPKMMVNHNYDDDDDQVTVARFLSNLRGYNSNLDKPKFNNTKFPAPPPRTTSKILPLATVTANNCPRKNRGGQDGKFRGSYFGQKTTDPSNSLKRVPVIPNLGCTQKGILGNYSINPRTGVAQAVQIRSVTTVCSAPPIASSSLNHVLSLEESCTNSL